MDENAWTNTFPDVVRSWLRTEAMERKNRMSQMSIGFALNAAPKGTPVEVAITTVPALRTVTYELLVDVTVGQMVYARDVAWPETPDDDEDDE